MKVGLPRNPSYRILLIARGELNDTSPSMICAIRWYPVIDEHPTLEDLWTWRRMGNEFARVTFFDPRAFGLTIVSENPSHDVIHRQWQRQAIMLRTNPAGIESIFRMRHFVCEETPS